MSFKIIATADLHLGRNSSRLPAGKQKELGPTLHVLKRLKKTVLDHQADVLVLAGDVFDAHNHFFDSYNDLTDFFGDLLREHVHILMTAGNHDFDILTEFVNYWNPPQTSAEFRLLGQKSTWETIIIENNKGEQLEVAGWSFSERYHRQNPIHHLSDTTRDTSIPSLVLVHGDISQPESPYAPLDINDLKRLDVDAWILGHIHKPQILSPAHPFIAYPGSPQPLSPKETGKHHLLLLEFNQSEPDPLRATAVALSPLIYKNVEIEINENDSEAELRSYVIEELKKSLDKSHFYVLQLLLRGRHKNLDYIKALAGELEGNETREHYIHTVEIQVQPAIQHLEILAAETNPAGVIAAALLDIKHQEQNNFVDELCVQIKQKKQDIYHRPTYNILEKFNPDEVNEESNRGYQENSEHHDELIEKLLWDMLYALQKQKEEHSHV